MTDLEHLSPKARKMVAEALARENLKARGRELAAGAGVAPPDREGKPGLVAPLEYRCATCDETFTVRTLELGVAILRHADAHEILPGAHGARLDMIP